MSFKMSKELLLLTFLILWRSIHAKTILDAINSNPNLSKAGSIIRNSEILSLLLTRRCTAFIPTNSAMKEYEGRMDDNLLLYHLVNVPYQIQDLPPELRAQSAGNPRLHVSRVPSGRHPITGWEDHRYFLNNAEVVAGNRRGEAADGQLQYLHIVDQVIAPTVAQVSAAVAHDFYLPDARKVLEYSKAYGLAEGDGLRGLFNHVKKLGILDIFQTEGKNTFFMPTSMNPRTLKLTDEQMIRSHIVPGETLFTRPAGRNPRLHHNSLAFTHHRNAFISLRNTTDARTNKLTYYVTSTVRTEGGDGGSAMARIVRGNIAVSNGVLHLIDRPLVLLAPNLESYLKEEDGQLSQFHRLMQDHHTDMIHQLLVKDDVTLFAPSNRAFNLVRKDRLNRVIANREKLIQMLNLHVINKTLTTYEIVEQSANKMFQQETMSHGRKLYFAVNDPNGVVPLISVAAGGVNATITTPNVATKNGVIHIIDRILGIPSQTIYEKLESDPMLSSTFALSRQEDWSDYLRDRSMRFTLFAPSNDAWRYIGREYSDAHTKLFSGQYPSHVEHIMQRHMIVHQDLSLEELEYLAHNASFHRGAPLQMTRDEVKFQVRLGSRSGGHPFGGKDKEYYLEWNGFTARVIRSDVDCVNGVVHVIDRVLMAKRDVTVSGSPRHGEGALLFAHTFCFVYLSLVMFNMYFA